MKKKEKLIRIFTIADKKKCCSKCCGCGKKLDNREYIDMLSAAIAEMGLKTEINYVSDERFENEFPPVAKMFSEYGPGMLPALAVGDDIISMGPASVEDAIKKIKRKI